MTHGGEPAEMHQYPMTKFAKMFREHSSGQSVGTTVFTRDRLEQYRQDVRFWQRNDCTTAVERAFCHAKSKGYTEKETRVHVLMMCRKAGEK